MPNAKVEITAAVRLIFESLPEKEGNAFMREVLAFAFDGQRPEFETNAFFNFRREYESMQDERQKASVRARHYRERQRGTMPDSSAPMDTARLYEAFCKIYPKQWNLGSARAGIVNAVARHPEPEFPDQLLRAVAEYSEAVAEWPEAEQRFILNANTFLDGDHYLDDRERWKSRIERETKSAQRYITLDDGTRVKASVL